jgi:dsRNA-specific ribonuclease
MSKSYLNEHAQRNRNTPASYTLEAVGGSDHQPTFTVTCEYMGFEASAKALTKKAAEQAAAIKIMELL